MEVDSGLVRQTNYLVLYNFIETLNKIVQFRTKVFTAHTSAGLWMITNRMFIVVAEVATAGFMTLKLKKTSTVFPRIILPEILIETKRIGKIHFSKKTRSI